MTYRDWDNAQSQTRYKRRWQTAVGALARAQYENGVKGECLEIAMKMLRHYASLTMHTAQETVDEIERHLAQLEKDDVSGD